MAASELVEIEDARRIVLDAVAPWSSVAVELDEALGRVLAQDIAASSRCRRSTARRWTASRSAPRTSPRRGRAAPVDAAARRRVARRAPRGGGARQRRGDRDLDRRDDPRGRRRGPARRGDAAGARRACEVLGAVARRAATSAAPARTCRPGQTVLQRGTRLGPAELGVLASLGRADPRARAGRACRVLVTGDELLEPGEPTRPGRGARLERAHDRRRSRAAAGAEVIGARAVGDDARATRPRRSPRRVADADVAGALRRRLGRRARPRAPEPRSARRRTRRFWGLALKPGSPTWFGTPRRHARLRPARATRSRRWSPSCCSSARRCARCSGATGRRAALTARCSTATTEAGRPRARGALPAQLRARTAGTRRRPGRRARTCSARCSARMRSR